ncbi:MAG TPA: hypothetical protein VJC14_01420 [Candidatus Paceibacterota bacterium]
MEVFPLYIYGVELVREVFLISIVAYSWTVRRPIMGPNNFSRVAGISTGLSASAWLASELELATIFIVITGVLGAVGLHKYYRAMKVSTKD